MRGKHADSMTSQDHSKPAIDRRKLLGSMATLGAGIAGSMIAPQKLHAASESDSHAAQENSAAPCGRSKVVASAAAPGVETNAGKIRGYKRNGIYIFKGVPYGASTRGRGRFMPPGKPEPWAGIRDTLVYGRISPSEESLLLNLDSIDQFHSDQYVFLIHRGSGILIPGEDCLRVNLWTPEINGNGKRPVMVWM